jgi:hypothetical protein
MALSEDRLKNLLKAGLDAAELGKGVVYVCTDPVDEGARLNYAHREIRVPWEALLAFVDREPLANWGHSCRYILVKRENGEISSVEARFPPFHSEDGRRWRVFYQAPGVPDAALAVPK